MEILQTSPICQLASQPTKETTSFNVCFVQVPQNITFEGESDKHCRRRGIWRNVGYDKYRITFPVLIQRMNGRPNAAAIGLWISVEFDGSVGVEVGRNRGFNGLEGEL